MLRDETDEMCSSRWIVLLAVNDGRRMSNVQSSLLVLIAMRSYIPCFWLPGMCTGYLLWLPVFPNKSNNTGEQFKIILFNEYGESELSSVMTNNDNSQLTLGLNINTTFPYFSSFDPASSPARRQRKIDRKITFFFFILYPMWPFHEKMINLIYHSPYGFFTWSPKPGSHKNDFAGFLVYLSGSHLSSGGTWYLFDDRFLYLIHSYSAKPPLSLPSFKREGRGLQANVAAKLFTL